MVKLWKVSVRPILEYGCQLWGGETSEALTAKLEALQCEFGRSVLGCKYAPQAWVRQELGLESLQLRWHMMIMKYWLRVSSMPDSRLVARVIRSRYGHLAAGGKSHSWCSSVLKLLDTYQASPEWRAIGVGRVDSEQTQRLKGELERRMKDEQKRIAAGQVAAHESLRVCRMVQDDEPGKGIRHYLLDRRNPDGVILWSRLRSGTLPLMCTLGKKLEWPESLQDCPTCHSGDRETEAHFLVVCPVYDDIRRKLLDQMKLVLDAATWVRWNAAFQVRDEVCCIRLLLSTRSGMDNDRREVDGVVKNFLVKLWKRRTELCGRWTVCSANGAKRLVQETCKD